MRGIRLSCILLLGILNIFCSSVIKETERIAAKHGAGAGDTQTPGTNTTPAPAGNITGTALWARSTSASPVTSPMSAVAVDSSGNVYAAGGQYGNGTYTYGGVNAIGFASAASNIMIVKYDASGTVQWVITNTAGTNGTRIYALAVDSSGNLYAAGSQNANISYTYGGVSRTGSVTNFNALLIKIDSAGVVQWVRSTSTGTSPNEFQAVATDSAGNIYAAGYLSSAITNTYDGASVTGSFGGGKNVLLVKYLSNGTGSWARSVNTGAAASEFKGVAVDSAGNIYAAGSQTNTGNYDYSGQIAAGASTTTNAVIVKYSNMGTALWARTTSGGTAASQFLSVAAESGGGVFAVGTQTGNTALTYGAQNVSGAFAGGTNSLAVKYDNSGNALWARSPAIGTNASNFAAAAADANGNMYAAGMQTGTGSYTYGTVSATGASGSTNAALVKYGPNGDALWAQSVAPAPSNSSYLGLACLNTDFLFAAGQQTGTGNFTYASQTVAGAGASTNALVVKFR